MSHLYTGLTVFILSTLTFVCYVTAKPNDDVTLIFSIHQEEKVYSQSNYGEPPQFAIWLENTKTDEIRTVAVTNNTATGNFEGRVLVPVSLPAWIGAFRKATGRDDFPTPIKPMDKYDAVSQPTPKEAEFSTQISVPEGSVWHYYVEVNVAGDYTSEFSLYQTDGARDFFGNGQPSIIYRGQITAKTGNESIPELIGRTEQLHMSTEINPDLEGIESAKELFKKIKVNCQ